MVERIFAEQTFTACLIEGDQAHNHLVRWRGLGECYGLLDGNALGRGSNGDVRQSELFDATLIADAEIDSLGPA